MPRLSLQIFLGAALLGPGPALGAGGQAAIVAAGLLALGLGLISWRYRRRRSIAGPIATVGQALRAVGAGELGRQLPAGLPPALDPIVAGYHEMTAALQRRQQALDQQLRRSGLLAQLAIELRETLDPATIAAQVLGATAANLGADEVSLILAGPSGPPWLSLAWRSGELVAIPAEQATRLIAHGLEGWVHHHGSSTLVGDLANSRRWQGQRAAGSAAVIPLRQADSIHGVIAAFSQAAHRFDSHDMLLLESVASQAAVALGAARRYHEEIERREQAIALLSVSQLLTAERSPSDLANMLEEQARGIFHADHGMLFLRPGGADLPPLPVGPAPADISPATVSQIGAAARQACAGAQISTGGGGPGSPGWTALPLIHGGRSIGAYVLLRRSGEGAGLSANLWSLLTTFTNIVAAACANLYLVDRLRSHAGQLESLVGQRTEELRRSRDLLRIIFDNLPEGLMLIDADGSLLAANNAFCRGIVGRPPQDLVGRPYLELWDDLRQNPELQLQPQGPAEEGGPATPAPDGPFAHRAGSWRILAVDIVGQRRWYEVERTPILDSDTRPCQSLERWRDVTHQEEIQRRMLLHEQLSSLGRLAASVAHEVGNPLQSTLGCLQLCYEEPQLPAGAREYLDLAISEIERMARTLDSLRGLYRPPQLGWECVDLNQVLRQVARFTQRQLEHARISLELDLADDLPCITGQPDALRQVFLNLLLNAQEASSAGGAISISSRARPSDRLCHVEIRDTGVGMSEEQLGQLFEPFHSGKAQGVGLGLYLSRQLIEQHSGRIQFRSALGHGTTVVVELPFA